MSQVDGDKMLDKMCNWLIL